MLDRLVEFASKTYPDLEPGFGPAVLHWRIDLPSNRAKPWVIAPLAEQGVTYSACPEYPANLMQSGGKSHFLVDDLRTTLNLLAPTDDPKKFKDKHRFFTEMLRTAAACDERLGVLADWLSDPKAVEGMRAWLSGRSAAPGQRALFLVDGIDLTAQESIKRWWRDQRTRLLATTDRDRTRSMVCLLTGDATAAAKTHEKVSGLKRFGGRGQDIVVGCDKPAFKSFGLEQGENSAMSEPVAKAYVEALDYLLANQCRSLETAAVVYWFKEQVPPADDPFALLYGLDSDETQAATASIQAKALLDSIRSGKRQDLASNHFYAMTMSGASGRVMLRDWMEGQFEQLVAHIHAWFDALSIVNREGQQLAPDPKFRAVVGALAAKELKEVPGSITSVLWHAALAEQPIPQPVMAQVLNRYRLSVVKDETPLHARLGLLKAYFVRKPQGGDPLMKPYLNPDHPNPAYQCGRLLAVLAQLQHAALGDVGAGVVQRFYPAASQTPGLTLGRLVANARNHLRKLDGGLAWWFEERIGEIMGRLRDEIPRTQNLEEQGLFALGYYQQLAALKAGKKSVDTSSEQ